MYLALNDDLKKSSASRVFNFIEIPSSGDKTLLSNKTFSSFFLSIDIEFILISLLHIEPNDYFGGILRFMDLFAGPFWFIGAKL